MCNICEISYLLKYLKNYESHLVLNIFDFLFASNTLNNCQYDLELIFLYCFGISLKTPQLNNLKNSIFEYVNIFYPKFTNNISIYNLKYYIEGCIKYYLKKYNKYYSNIYENVIKYNKWVINSYGNFITMGIITDNIKYKTIKNRLDENKEFQKKLDKQENIIKIKILNVIF